MQFFKVGAVIELVIGLRSDRAFGPHSCGYSRHLLASAVVGQSGIDEPLTDHLIPGTAKHFASFPFMKAAVDASCHASVSTVPQA